MTVETINPATGKVEYRHELMTAAQVDATLAAAQQAFPAWAALSLAERGEVDRSVVRAALDRYRLWDPMAADAGNTEGGG